MHHLGIVLQSVELAACSRISFCNSTDNDSKSVLSRLALSLSYLLRLVDMDGGLGGSVPIEISDGSMLKVDACVNHSCLQLYKHTAQKSGFNQFEWSERVDLGN